jgi:DNA-binding SARP family transcriptional activator
MVQSDDKHQSKYFLSPCGSPQWQNVANLLKLMQNDYQGARRQIEQISSKLAEGESLVNQHLQYAFLNSQGYRTLCLAGNEMGFPNNRMGNIVLGEVTIPAKIPEITRIEIRCLGRFEVNSTFSQVDCWHSIKAKSVFQYLLIKPREPTVKEILMETLWPDYSPQAASNNLKAAIHNLRLILNNVLAIPENIQCVLFRHGSYIINPEINMWIDIEEFEKCWVSGRRFEKEGKICEAIQEFEKAEALYRGDYLEDECYEEWTLLRRETLKDIYLIILSKLSDYSMHQGDYESCIHYSQKILAKDPCREDTYRSLMFCYTKLGQRNRALRWYEICRQTNKSELNTEPENKTIVLYNKIFRDENI